MGNVEALWTRDASSWNAESVCCGCEGLLLGCRLPILAEVQSSSKQPITSTISWLWLQVCYIDHLSTSSLVIPGCFFIFLFAKNKYILKYTSLKWFESFMWAIWLVNADKIRPVLQRQNWNCRFVNVFPEGLRQWTVRQQFSIYNLFMPLFYSVTTRSDVKLIFPTRWIIHFFLFSKPVHPQLRSTSHK